MEHTTTQLTTEFIHNTSRLEMLLNEDLLSNEEIVHNLNRAISISIDWFIQTQTRFSSSMNLEKLFLKMLRIVCVTPKRTTLANLVGQLRYTDDPVDIALLGELAVHACEADLFDMVQSKAGYISIEPLFLCDPKLIALVQSKEHMPPMICEPKHLLRNTSSAYLSVDVDSLILKKGNHHNGDICLDSLNQFNKVALELDMNMLTEDNAEHQYLLDEGNKFYLPHKYDKRGRTYCVGYHTTYQGDEYRKSILNFHSKEIIEGF